MMTANGRNYHSWIGAFEELTNGIPSPRIFRKWAAIAGVAGALERKVWSASSFKKLYPNLYITLVGPPGVGKTNAIVEMEFLWSQLKTHFVAPTSMTKASLLDALAGSKRTIVRPGENPGAVTFHSLLVPSPELGVLLSGYDGEFMNVMTDLFDCRDVFEERLRSRKEHLVMENPQINLLAGCTPGYLADILPEIAWVQGYTARQLFIFSGEPVKVKLLTARSKPDTELLQADLKTISELYGPFRWQPEAETAIEAWWEAGGPPAPEHMRLESYIPRRPLFLMKLAMVASASQRDDLIVTLDDYQIALDWIIEAEFFMGDIFKSLGSSGDGKIIEETWNYLWSEFGKDRERKPFAKARILGFIQNRAPVHAVEKALEMLVKTERLKIASFDSNGNPFYEPLGKVKHN